MKKTTKRSAASRLIGYARVSTGDQTPDLQLDALMETGCDERDIFVETASGAQRDRPQLKAALEYAREGDVLIVWKLDRLARSTRQLVNTVEDLRERGVGFKSLTDHLDTTTPQGKLVFTIFSGLAEFERDIIRERTKAGLAAARERGRVGGRPPALSEDDRKVALSLMHDDTISMREIAKRLGVSEAGLYRHFPGGRAAALEEA